MTALELKPSTKEQQLALKSLKLIQNLKEQSETKKKTKIKIKADGEDTFIELPMSAMNILYTVVSEMAAGKTITFLPSDMARQAEADNQIARARIW